MCFIVKLSRRISILHGKAMRILIGVKGDGERFGKLDTDHPEEWTIDLCGG